MDYPDLTGEQVKRLVNMAKLIGGFTIFAIALVASVAIYFSYDSVQDAKKEVHDSTNEIKDKVDNLLTYSQNEIDRINSYSEKQIKYTTDDAVYQARKSAQKEVEHFFNNDDQVKALVRNTAETVLGNFEKEINDFTLELPDVFIALDKIGRDQREGLEKIIALKNSQNIFVRKIATRVFEEKRNDYFNVFNNLNGTFWNGSIAIFLKKIEKDPSDFFAFADFLNSGNRYITGAANANLWKNPDKTGLINQLIKNVNSNNDLDIVALSYFVVLEMTNIKCELFNFKDFAVKSKNYKIKEQYRKSN